MAEAAVEQAGQALLDAPVASINNVVPLLAKLKDPEEHEQGVLLTAIEALKLFFQDAFAAGHLPVKRQKVIGDARGKQDAAEVHAAWLSRQYASYQERLMSLVAHQQPVLQVAAMAAVLQAARSEMDGGFTHPLFRRALSAALTSGHTSGELLGVLANKYLAFADIRYHALLEVQSLAGKLAAGGGTGSRDGQQEASRPLFDFLMAVPPTPPEEEFTESITSWSGAAESGLAQPAAGPVRKKRKGDDGSSSAGSRKGEAVRWMTWDHQRRVFGEAWLALLRVDLPEDLLKRLLVRMHDLIIPAAPNPLLLADFLSSCTDHGGMTGMLALNGLFILVTRHGLEYPDFYKRLYNLLSPDVFQAKHRVRFFQLADIFLASGLVPAYTAAAFAKRFGRLALRAPPAGATICLAFIHNLLRRHPACTQLLHRPAAEAATAPAGTLGVASAAAAAEDAEDAADLSGDAAEAAAPLQGAAKAAANGHVNGVGGVSESSSDSEAEAALDAPDVATETAGRQAAGADVYDEREPDPAKCNALQSSLWEVASLRTHYDPQVATFIAHLDKDLSDRRKTSEIDVQPLLGDSYAARMAAQLKRRLKAAPVAFYAEPPQSLFGAAAGAFAGWSMA